MEPSFVCISDTHLGYDRSLLNDLDAQDILATEMGRLCGGSGGVVPRKGKVDYLILNGDIWEGCIPKDAGAEAVAGVTPFLGQVSRTFFAALDRHLEYGQLVIVPGNHDFTLFRPQSYPTHILPQQTNHVEPLSPTLRALLFPPSLQHTIMGVAPSVFFLRDMWPYTSFHHGYFLDDLIIGQGDQYQYVALDCYRPSIQRDGRETLRYLQEQTHWLLQTTYPTNSSIRDREWAIIRRDEYALRCPRASWIDKGCSIAAMEVGINPQLGKNLDWFLSVLMNDPWAPSLPVDFVSTSKTAEAPTKPSHFIMGHDHYGGQGTYDTDGMPFVVLNTGGWTDDGGAGIHPHGHVVWSRGGIPNMETIRIK